MELSQEQIDFLKSYSCYFIPTTTDNKYPYLHSCDEKNHHEIYNIESVNLLIEEIKTNGKPLFNKNSIHYKTLEGDFFEIDGSQFRFVDMVKNRKTGELEVERPIRKAFPPYKKSIIKETEAYCEVVSRYNGDFGDGSQYIQRVYKGIQSAQKAAIPILINQQKKFETQIGYIKQLIQKYQLPTS